MPDVPAAKNRPEVKLSLFADGFDYFANSEICDLYKSDIAIDSLLYAVDQILNSEGKEGAVLNQKFRLHVSIFDIPEEEAIPIGGKIDDKFFWSETEFVCNNEKFLLVIPFFGGVLQNACILPALRAGLAVNSEYRKCEFLSNLPHYPKSADYKDIFEINYANPKRHVPARNNLYQKTKDWCKEIGISPADFANLDNMAKLEELASLLNINLVVYDQELGSHCVLQTPAKYDSTKETISLLLMNTGTGVKHVGVIKNVGKFFHSSNSIRCLFCSKNYSATHYGHHLCKGTALCTSCRRPEAKLDDYTDYQIRRQRCMKRLSIDVEEECSTCKKSLKTEQCKKQHKKLCDGKLGYCVKCHSRYRKSTKEEHKCNRKFCTTCKSFYDIGDVAGEHNCAMPIPTKQKHYNRIIAFDMETTVKDNSHVVCMNCCYDCAYAYIIIIFLHYSL